MSDDGGADRTASGPSRSSWRFIGLYVVPSLVLLIVAMWPVISGAQTLFFRDVTSVHLEMKWFQAQAMRDGYLPIIDHMRGGGQPHLGNPNTVALYPDNVLYLVADPLWALNAHFWIHLLLAPFTLYWLARVWGLRREAAWIGGVAYAVSGYFVSTLNLYNMIATVFWAPALAAAAIGLAGPGRRVRWLWATAVVWALVILSGEPVTAILSVLLALSGVVARYGFERCVWKRQAVAFSLGSLLSAPLVLEFLRILSLSYRGHWGYAGEEALKGSWHPARLIELVIPMAFGRPDFQYWGSRFHSDGLPLLFSLFPGVLVVALAIVGSGSGGGGHRLRRWALGAIAVGIFFALGGLNPLVVLMMKLPGAGMFRMPVKFWLLVAVGFALLVASGAERVLSGRGRTFLLRSLGLVAGLLGLFWLALVTSPEAVEEMLYSWMPAGTDEALAASERLRWAGLTLFSLVLAAVGLLVTQLGRRRLQWALPLLLAMHVASQLFFLRPLYEFDDVTAYRLVSPIATVVPVGARVVHGTAASGLFESSAVDYRSFPTLSVRWAHRGMFERFFPVAGIMAGRLYEYSLTPEGLDSFLTRVTVRSLPQIPDTAKLRVLAASGVEWLLLGRRLGDEAAAANAVELVERFETMEGPIHVYRFRRTAAPAQFVGTVHSSAHMNEALAKILDPEFDVLSEAVLAGQLEEVSGASGSVVVRLAKPERMIWEVTSDGAGALLVQRAHLPLYRARVDGELVPVHVANLSRMAIRLDGGKHTVELEVDRRYFRLGMALVALALTALAVLSIGARPARWLALEEPSGERAWLKRSR